MNLCNAPWYDWNTVESIKTIKFLAQNVKWYVNDIPEYGDNYFTHLWPMWMDPPTWWYTYWIILTVQMQMSLGFWLCHDCDSIPVDSEFGDHFSGTCVSIR